MIRLDDREPIINALRGGVIALGNFDGFHLGHQAVVGTAISWARAKERPAIVATFDPHPMRLFNPGAKPFRLTTLDQRQKLFAGAGADAMLVFHFTREMAAMTAEEWIATILHEQLGASAVVTGQDFTFGKGRNGDALRLAEIGAKYRIAARSVGAVNDRLGPISSSRIRTALEDGDCATAERLLTRPYAIRGTVEHGDKRGRTIGYPTANVALGQYLRPRYGIYAVTARIMSGSMTGMKLRGAANIGIRPTFEPPKELLEPYFFDFDGNLYGQEIEVAFHHYLRGEEKFASLDGLMAQMAKDCDQARALLAEVVV